MRLHKTDLSLFKRLTGARFRRRAWLPAALLSISMAAAGCALTADGNEDQIRVAFVNAHMTSSFRTQMVEGARQAAKENGVKLTVFNSNNEIIKQNEAIDNYVTQGYDVIAVAAIEVESVLPVIRAAADEGVKIVSVDTVLDDEAVSAQIGVDNGEGGQKMGEEVVNYVEENQIDPRVGIVGAFNSEIQNLRRDSFAEVVESSGASVVQAVDGQNRQEIALAGAENLLTSHANLPVLYATGEPALVGTLAAVRSQGRADDVKVFGWDLSQESIRGIDSGLVVAVAHQPAFQEGVTAVETAVALANGEDVPEEQFIPIEIVTKENVDEYRSIFE